jgi:hypothetical protein
MKKMLLFAGSVALQFTLNAQITIGTADMPAVNDSLKVSLTNSVGAINSTLTGANYTWDFTTLVPTTQTVYHFDNPANFTLPFNILFNIFNTSYGLYNYTPDSIPGFPIRISKSYDFYKNSASAYKLIGKGLFINNVPTPTMYSSIDYVFRFPMNYLNMDSCDYKYGTTVPTIGYYGQKGHRVNTVDGWGTLKTPYGTFQTLRVKSAIAMTDTIYSSTLSIGFAFPRPLTVQYKWMASGGKIPILEVDGTMVGPNFTVTNVVYRDSARSSVSQLGIHELGTSPKLIKTWPNPASSLVYFDVQGIDAAGIDIYGMNGTILSSVNITTETPVVDMSGYAQGLYFFDVRSKEYQVIGRGKIAVLK